MKNFILLVAILAFCAVPSLALSAMSTEALHEKLIYPVVRVNEGGSGTIVYSKPNDDGGYSTYVLTNYHVVDNAISVVNQWDSDLQKEVKIEKRKLIYAEIFKYKNMSIPIGTLKVEANIVLYNKDEDMALIKLSLEEPAKYVAELYPYGMEDDLHVTDETIAVGCSMGWPPIPAMGMITRMNVYIDSLIYHMSESQIIFGNSGGAMYRTNPETGIGEYIGMPSRVVVVGWSSAVSHMGVFIPVNRIYDWLERENYQFIYDDSMTEKEGLEAREKEIEAKIGAKR
jgi:S1-C subfamily serine protease